MDAAMNMTVSRLLIPVVVITSVLALLRFLGRRKGPLPPGPKGWPIIGSMLDMPTGKHWLGYDAISKQYGDLVSFEVLGTTYVLVSSMKRAHDLFGKRSAICSDRPNFTMSADLVGFDYLFTELHYGDWWRRHRRTFHDFFHPGAVGQYKPIQMATARDFIKRLESSPEQFLHHIRHALTATIMKVTYDIDIEEKNDQYVLLADETLEVLAATLLPGRFYVDTLPILKYVPSWMPGAGFKRKAAEWRVMALDFLNRPFKAVEDGIEKGQNSSCVAAELIAKLPSKENRAEEEQIAKNVCAIAYAGGADTTFSACQVAFLALVLYPEVQKKAQAEIDAVVGSDRMPDFDDRESLPYINALLKETMRWQTISPLAVPHRIMEDMVYDGYCFKKGTLLLGNNWTILHDPETYPEPQEFRPERYLKDGKPNPDIPLPADCGAFGFGRRICPGRFLSDNSLYSVIVSTLAVYDITPVPGEPLPAAEMVPSAVSFPEPFNCVIKPRSEAAAKLIAGLTE